MSELASRLAALRRQAGASMGKASTPPKAKPPQTAVTVPSARSVPDVAPGVVVRGQPDGASGKPAALRDASFPAGRGTATSVLKARGVDLTALRRMAGVRERLGQPRATSSQPVSRDVPGDELVPGLRYLERRFAWAEPPAELDLSFARLTSARREHLLHFDTETTGLAGGTGTRAFMIGAADWHDGALRVRQLYITTMAAETAMLRAFAEWIHEATVLVSYNGKSYDAPLLATRYRLARLSNPLLGLTHVDLLHPMRRRYRQVWENCRMQTAERQLLRIVREDDLPGSEAPRAWLTYLRGGSSTNLVRVAEHNLQDVRTLSGLLIEAHGWANAIALGVPPGSPASNEK